MRVKVTAVLVGLAMVVSACGAQGPATGPLPVPESPGERPGEPPVATLALGGLLDGRAPMKGAANVAVTSAPYDLGQVTLVDGAPAPLRGIIALPADPGAIADRLPVVVLLHGNHPICRDDPAAYGSWPCRPGTEFRNEEGLAWLLGAIAARGVVAIAPAVNVQYTLGAGEPAAAVRTAELVVRTLDALERGELPVAPELVDLQQLVLGGHSTGGQDANILARGTAGIEVGAGRNVVGLVLIQPALNAVEALVLHDVPSTVIVNECDGDVRLTGGTYVSQRLLRSDPAPVALVVLEGGSHNATNSGLGPDGFPIESLTCEAERVTDPQGWAQSAEAQRERLAPIVSGAVSAVVGSRADGWAGSLFDEPATPSGAHLTVVPGAARVPAFPGPTATSIGPVTTDGVTLTWCRPEYTTPLMAPGTEPCHRPELALMVGQPSSVAFVWDRAGASATFPLEGSTGDVLRFRVFPDVADVRIGQGPIVLRLTADDGSSVDVEVPVPPVLRFTIDSFDIAAALVPWWTARISLGAHLQAVTIGVVSPDSGAIQIVSLGVD